MSLENKIDFVTGLPIGEDGKLPVEGKKMCLNCTFCESGTTCINDKNMNMAREKVLAAVPGGYEITNLELKPLPLKDATKKCSNWSLDRDLINEWLEKIFA